MVLDQLQSPVVLAPLAGGPSTPELAAAVSNAGGLGFLATGYLKAADVAPRLHAARQLTAQPLGVNVFAQGAPADPSAYRAHVERFRIWASRHGAEVGEPRYDDDDWEAKIDLLASSPPAVVSFTFGRPPQDVVERLHDAGSEVWVTITSPEEAHAAAAVGADVLVVQGAEAGGHRGSFDNRDELPIYGLLPLLDLVSAAVTLPLVASGGIATGRALAAVLCAGASAAQIGTAFMLAPEAGTNAAHREALRARGETVLTRAFTGRLARGIRNEFITEHQDAPAAYPELHYLTSPMRKQAREQGDVSRINLWAGEAHELAVERPAAETVRELTASASAALESALEAQRTRARSQGASDAGASDPLRHPRAKALAREWYEAWNAHDLERILAHYAADVAFSSPFISALGADASGRVFGKEALRAYWAKALQTYPDLHFEPIAELYGVQSITLHYRGIGGMLAAEVLELGHDGLIWRATAHYDRIADTR